MKRTVLFAAAILTAVFSASAQNTEVVKSNLQKHVYYLASDDLNGRKAASEDARKAAEYIRSHYEEMGLQPYYDTWYQDFDLEGDTYRNIVAEIEGNDPVLKNEYIVIGAHYDHLGIKNGKVYNGADDNASGSAALIEVARILVNQKDKLKRSIIIAAFDGEELGLYGSRQLAKRLKAEKVNIKLMMSLDMVGWLEEGKTLKLEGSATIKDGKDILEKEAKKFSLPVKTKDFETSVLTATDTEYFAKNGIPTLAVTTGTKSPYHKPEDDAELIDYDGMTKVTSYVADITTVFANSRDFQPSGQVAKKHEDTSRNIAFRLGVVAGTGDSYLDFRKAAFTGKPSSSWQVGIVGRFDYKWTGIKAEVLYSQMKLRVPDPVDTYTKYAIYKQQSIVIPVEALIQVPGSFGIWYGIGGYGEIPVRMSECDYDPAGLQTGLSMSFGVSLGSVDFGGYARRQMNDIFKSGGAPDSARSINSGFRMTIMF